MLTPAQVAERYNVHRRTVLNWLKRKENPLPGVQFGRKYAWRIPEQELEAWVAQFHN